MTKLFVYDIDTRNHLATIIADDLYDATREMTRSGFDLDYCAGTASPAFGTSEGLIPQGGTEVIDVRREEDTAAEDAWNARYDRYCV